MKLDRNVTLELELPLHGTGDDYAHAIARAIAASNGRGDESCAAALGDLMSAIKVEADHRPDVELGPYFAAIG